MEALKKIPSNEEEKILTKEEVLLNRDRAISKLSSLIEDFANSPETLKKANNLAYWISQYSTSISFEKDFNPQRLKRYKRGDIVKVHLGFNVGNELGGLHYCVVLDTGNSMRSGTITVVPLTSSKEGKTYHSSTVNLGEEIYLNLKKKLDLSNDKLFAETAEIVSLKNKFDSLDEKQKKEYYKKLNKSIEDLILTQKLENEIDRMKQGSIALVSQIRTVSKQRIYDPQTYKDIMSGVKISSDSLTLIDDKIKELFIKS